MKNYIYSERTNLFEPNIYIQFLVKVIGNRTPDALISAVKAAFSVNEATMSRIVLDSSGDAFYEKLSESGCKVSVSNSEWQDIIKQNEKVPFSLG